MIEEINNYAEIENLYKAGSNAPYERVKNGFGYWGVLLKHKKSGKIHCHICGNWYTSLGQHVALKHHVKSKEYKKKYGFSALQPLCSIELSLVNSKNALKKISEGKFANSKGKPFKKNHKINKNHQLSMAYWNSHSICPEQIVARVMGLADQIGHYPSSTELREHDNSLYMLIMRRHGNWNNFKRKQGLPLRKNVRRVTRERAIFAIRQSTIKLLRTRPTQGQYAKIAVKNNFPSTSTIGRIFGSWNRALHAAGFTTTPPLFSPDVAGQ